MFQNKKKSAAQKLKEKISKQELMENQYNE